MFVKASRLASAAVLFGLCVYWSDPSTSQEPPPVRNDAIPPGEEIPKGVEVQARGPIHEAFASPNVEPKETPPIAKRPPAPIEEMPPEDKPEGDVVWIGGYYAFDDDRQDFMWVSGCWRIKPVNKEWVPGYWREVSERWQWVPGFWTSASVQDGKAAESVTYFPQPPAPPNVAPPGNPPEADTFYIPGYWMWSGDRYVWRAGYWTRIRPGYVYVPSHFAWTPSGYVFVPGYWDLAVSRRGVMYAPVYVDAVIVGPRYVYTPHYAVRDTLVLDTMFIRPAAGAYYFGDYYGPRYVEFGFEPVVVYSRRHYEPIIVYERWNYRDNPRWLDVQITLVGERNLGRAPLPPRVVNVNIRNVTYVNNLIAPTRTVMAAQGVRTVPMSPAARAEVRQAAVARQRTLTAERHQAEAAARASGPLTRPRATAMSVTNHAGNTGAPGSAAKTGATNPTVSNPGTHPGVTSTTHPGVGPANPLGTKGGPAPKKKEEPKKKA